jgi:hypothetical protein
MFPTTCSGVLPATTSFERSAGVANAKTGRSCTCSLPGRSGMAVNNHSFDRWGSIKSVGWILEKRRRRCRSWIGIVLRANSKVGFSFEFGNDFPILIRQTFFPNDPLAGLPCKHRTGNRTPNSTIKRSRSGGSFVPGLLQLLFGKSYQLSGQLTGRAV